MKLSELKKLIETRYEIERYDDYEIVIPVKVAGSVGGTPAVKVKSMHMGFDWDQGKIFLYPEKDLRECDRDELKAIQKHLDEIGWDQYENRNLKRELKEYKKKYEELKFRMDGLEK